MNSKRLQNPNSGNKQQLLAQFILSLAVCTETGVMSGCYDTSPPPVDMSGPLTLDEWKTLPVSLKYDEASFDRLRLHDPGLNKDQNWDQFMRDVVIPEREKDIPLAPGETSPY